MPSPAPAMTFRDLGLAWTLTSEQRAGRGRVVWLALTPANERLRTSMDPDALRIEETGRVPSARVINRTPSPTVLFAHMLLVGGLQTRTVERSVVLGPSAEALVPVRCVERRRWQPRDGQTAGRFQLADRLSIAARATLSRSKSDSLQATGMYQTSQSHVWQEVDAELDREKTTSTTRSYEAVSHVRQRRVEEARRADLSPPPQANAMLVVSDGGGVWLEAFAMPASLAQHSASIAADLFGDAAPVAVARRVPTLEAALDWIWRRQVVPLPTVPGTLGRSMALASTRASGEVLLFDGGLAHAMVSASLAVG